MEANRFDSMTQAPPVMVDASQAIQVTIGERWTESTVREKWAWPLADLGDAIRGGYPRPITAHAQRHATRKTV
jgi:hypothetical protein